MAPSNLFYPDIHIETDMDTPTGASVNARAMAYLFSSSARLGKALIVSAPFITVRARTYGVCGVAYAR